MSTYDDLEWGDDGAIQSFIRDYVENGNLDALTGMMNQPWAHTKNGEAILADAIRRAKAKALESRQKRDHQKFVNDTINSSWK
jgi:hypothetical protein